MRRNKKYPYYLGQVEKDGTTDRQFYHVLGPKTYVYINFDKSGSSKIEHNRLEFITTADEFEITEEEGFKLKREFRLISKEEFEYQRSKFKHLLEGLPEPEKSRPLPVKSITEDFLIDLINGLNELKNDNQKSINSLIRNLKSKHKN